MTKIYTLSLQTKEKRLMELIEDAKKLNWSPALIENYLSQLEIVREELQDLKNKKIAFRELKKQESKNATHQEVQKVSAVL